LGCDYFSAYRKYMGDFGVLLQFCLAHLIRDVKFLAGHPNKKNQAYGQLLVEDLRRLFGVIHRREQYASPETFQRKLEQARDQLVWDATRRCPFSKEASNIADRFRENAESYFRFITEPDVEPTNNLAEQAIRFVAIHRRMTQGTRGEDGRRWCDASRCRAPPACSPRTARPWCFRTRTPCAWSPSMMAARWAP
jgi:hypothetical protein